VPQHLAVVGGGIAGLASAYFVHRELPETRITVFEKEEEVGGVARSAIVEGFTVDYGPNGFLANVADTLELAKAVGLESELRPAAAEAKHRFLYKGGRLRALPASPGGLLRSDLLGPAAKLRAALEPFAPRRQGEGESVYAFAARRLGPRVAETFVAPMVIGIAAGDARQLELASLFPRVREMEDEHGSLLRALLAGRKGAKGRPAGRLTSFRRSGMAALSRALHAALGGRVRTGEAVVGLERSATGYVLSLASGEKMTADAVVLATPAYLAARLLDTVLPQAARDLEAIPYAGVRVLGLGFSRDDVPHPLDGFGFLVPRGEDVRILGCLWTSSIFPEQAPEGKALLRVIAGGVFDPDLVALSDEEALRLALADLKRSMGITAPPEVVHQVAWERGIPQYLVGHRERVARVMKATSAQAGLFLAGNAYYGVGLNDCVRDARRVTQEVKAFFEAKPETPA
jgi:protoporphyrinogen/coproporphyrinogen III oxidase